MIEQSFSRVSPSKPPKHVPQTTEYTVVIVGGTRIFRLVLQQWLTGHNLAVPAAMASEHDLAEWLASDPAVSCDVVIHVLSSASPFAALGHVRDALRNAKRPIPLAILADRATRGQVYAALRIGAKAFVNLDAEGDELLKAITMAAADKVYLGPDAAEVLVNDVSVAIDGPSATPRLPCMALSQREVEIVQLLCEGLSSKQIARSLHISAKTVENHRYNIYRKSEAEGLPGLMRYAIRHGLIAV